MVGVGVEEGLVAVQDVVVSSEESLVTSHPSGVRSRQDRLNGSFLPFRDNPLVHLRLLSILTDVPKFYNILYKQSSNNP